MNKICFESAGPEMCAAQALSASMECKRWIFRCRKWEPWIRFAIDAVDAAIVVHVLFAHKSERKSNPNANISYKKVMAIIEMETVEKKTSKQTRRKKKDIWVDETATKCREVCVSKVTLANDRTRQCECSSECWRMRKSSCEKLLTDKCDRGRCDYRRWKSTPIFISTSLFASLLHRIQTLSTPTQYEMTWKKKMNGK